jgi:hypothetical protein
MKLPIHINIFGNCPEDQLTLAYLLAGHLRAHGFDAVYQCPNVCEEPFSIQPHHSFVISLDHDREVTNQFLEQNNYNIWVEFSMDKSNIDDIPFSYTGKTKEQWVVDYNIKFDLDLYKIDENTARFVEDHLLNPERFTQ